ncbi:DinB family protein [Micromonospora sp. NPDC049679]|uniref:DinB family protein n=1 Tax=Micromonospora sp. NPDC049679 TaxID=3155920 RepID=UPI0033F14072
MSVTPVDPTVGVVAARVGGERETLEAFLDFYRGVIVRKVRGVSDEDARRQRLPSQTTLAGVLKHLIVVEGNWFQRILAQRQVKVPGPGEPDWSWQLADRDTVDSLIMEYEQACALSRELAAGFSLDHVVPHEWLGEVSLRWIYVHLIDEVARHAGHADILRELTDGETGAIG